MKQYELDLMIYFLGILMSLCCFSLKPVDLGSLHFFCCQCFQMFCCEVFFGNFKNRSSVPPKRFSMRSEPRRLPKHWRLKKKQKLYCIERERERVLFDHFLNMCCFPICFWYRDDFVKRTDCHEAMLRS